MNMMNKKTAKLMVLTMLLSFATTVKAENTVSSVVSFKATASKDSFKKTVETNYLKSPKQVSHFFSSKLKIITKKSMPMKCRIRTNFSL